MIKYKKIKYLAYFFCFFFICGFLTIVKAEEKSVQVDGKEKKLLGECIYEYGDNKEIILYILDDFTIYNLKTTEYEEAYSGPYASTEILNNIVYDDYVDKKGSLSCNNLSIVYLKKTLTSTNPRDAHTTFKILTRKDNEGGHFNEYKLNTEKSKIYNQNYDKEVNEKNNWIFTCHYNNFYFSFNKKTYETNIPLQQTEKELFDILAENSYSCPTSLCAKTYSYGNYSTTIYSFKNEYDKECYISTNYSSDYKCGSLAFYMEEYTRLKDKIDDLNEFKNNENRIKKFCDSVLKNLDYIDSNSCVKECLAVSKIISQDKKKEYIQCGFSQKLIIWIANIVKWVKYIIPVLVIVLGILDFIKAIAGDKDDEMKKAQGRFVKRLIAAALIFIIPFIIEFVLEKMGFASNGCGIIDL